MCRSRSTVTLAAVALTAMTSLSYANDVSYRVLAVSGDTAPGTSGGVFTGFGIPRLNDAGEVAFAAATTAQLGSTGMWRTRAATLGQLHLLAGADMPVPGAPGGTTYGDFDFSFYHPLLNEAGNVGFAAPIVGHPDGDIALLREIDGVVAPNALPGEQVPGLANGITFEDFSNLPAFNDSNLMIFRADLAGPGVNETNDRAIMANWFGGVQKIVREGDAAPGLAGTSIEFVGSFPQMNENGKMAFRLRLEGNHAGSSIWSGWPGLFEPALLPGTMAPNGQPFADWTPGFWGLFLSLDGVSFSQYVEPAADEYSVGLWHHDGTETHTLGVEGDAAPIGSFEYLSEHDPKVNAHGTSVFTGRFGGQGVTDNDDSALFRTASGAPTQVLVREGDSVAGGWGVDTEFDAFSVSGGSETIDDAGRVYFTNRVRGGGINDDNNYGMWAVEPNGYTRLIIREGQWIDLGAAGSKQVATFQLGSSAGTQTGRAPSVNDYGDVAIRVEFADGTVAILVSQFAPTCPGDVNFDGFVDFNDLLMVLANFGANGPIGQNGDADEDGDIDFDDLLIVLSEWGTNCFPT